MVQFRIFDRRPGLIVMLVDGLVFFVLLIVVDLLVLLAFALEMRLTRAFGTDGAEGDHLLKFGVVA